MGNAGGSADFELSIAECKEIGRWGLRILNYKLRIGNWYNNCGWLSVAKVGHVDWRQLSRSK